MVHQLQLQAVVTPIVLHTTAASSDIDSDSAVEQLEGIYPTEGNESPAIAACFGCAIVGPLALSSHFLFNASWLDTDALHSDQLVW
jgi:hypothetical protein